MVFSSLPFLVLFLPVVLLAVSLARRHGGHGAVVATLLAASWLFYACWDWRFVPLLWGSILFNHAWARLLITTADDRRRGHLLAIGIAANLLVLGFFKYAGWLAGSLEALADDDWEIPKIVLPLGISFITFQKIAFLADVARTRPMPSRLPDFALFASFFPQLVAGPIVHHHELLPQIRPPRLGAARRSWRHGPGHWPTACSFTSTSRAMPTWRSDWRCCGGSGCRPTSLRRALAARLPAPLAHHPVAVPARLPLPAAGRQPARTGA